jgi:protein-tyrosine-phosphatase
MKLLFVCTGNVCRSLLAERLAQRLGAIRGVPLSVKSCGVASETHFAVPPEIWEALAEAGIASRPHVPQLVSRELLAWADEVLVMTARQLEALRDAFPEHRAKLQLLTERAGMSGDVADPIGKPWEAYRDCSRVITGALDKILAAPKG